MSLESNGETPAGIGARFRLRYPASGNHGFRLDVDLLLPGRGITAIFGRSGSGKTTLLRCIAGLQKAPHGVLTVNGERWQDGRVFLPTHKRPLGYVFQESSLFPHLSARRNLGYAVKRADGASEGRYEHVVALMDLEPLLDQYPSQLSGGERQRVAVARALLINPRLLLMDEPLASLDAARKREILPYLEKLREELEIPILYVSHSFDEVARLANHLVVLEEGKVVAQGPLADVLSRVDLPIRLGDDTGVVFEARVEERRADWHLARVAFPGGSLWVRDYGDSPGQRMRLRILARDVSVTLTEHSDSSILNRLAAKVIDIADDADEAMSLVRLKVGECVIVGRLTRRSVEHLRLGADSDVWAQIKSIAIVR